MTMRAVSGIGGSGGGIGLKSAGVLAQSAAPASVTGTVSETTLATIAIPAGTMGLNGALRITSIWSYTNSANNKTVRARFSGQALGSTVMTTTATASILWEAINRGALNSQVTNGAGAGAGLVASGNAVVTMTVDTSITQNLILTATLANTGETITLEGYTVEVLNP